MWKAASLLVATFLSATAAGTAIRWLNRASLPYENGRFFDEAEGVVYDDGAVVAYAALTVLLTMAAIAAMLWARRAWWK